MILIETPVFTAQVKELLPDEDYRRLQWHLARYPYAGDVIQGTGSLRKIRWTAGGKGKSGGVRVIYFHVVSLSQIRLLLIYRKGLKDDLSRAEKKVLRAINEDW
jgi:hypothetical protein